MAGSGLEANGSAPFAVLVGNATFVVLEGPDPVVVTAGVDAVVGDDEETVGLVPSPTACVAIALIDELSSAVGGAGVAAAAGLFSEDAPANGAKKSRLNAA